MDETFVEGMVLSVIEGIEDAGGSRRDSLTGITMAFIRLIQDSNAEETALATEIPLIRSALAASSYDKFRSSHAIH